MTFNALIVDKDEDGKTHAAVKAITQADMPQSEVTVAVEYSTVNYKDGLCIFRGLILPVRSKRQLTRATSPATKWF
jgi:acrylyl-CoA reductase (NADPH)